MPIHTHPQILTLITILLLMTLTMGRRVGHTSFMEANHQCLSSSQVYKLSYKAKKDLDKALLQGLKDSELLSLKEKAAMEEEQNDEKSEVRDPLTFGEPLLWDSARLDPRSPTRARH